MISLQPPPANNRAEHPYVGTCTYHGIKIHIENKKGSMRSGQDKNGKRWRTKLGAHYGEITHFEGTDGDPIDVYLLDECKDGREPSVYVIDQNHPESGKFDEQKVILGAPNAARAVSFYRSQYDAPGFFGGCHTLSLARFKELLSQRKRSGTPIRKAVMPMSAARRARTPKKQFAGPHDSFPIQNHSDAVHAAELLHHASDPAEVKAHVLRICKMLGIAPPKTWEEGEEGEEQRKELKKSLTARLLRLYRRPKVIILLKAADLSPHVPASQPPGYHQQAPQSVQTQHALAGPDSKTLHTTPQGTYHPERAALHEHIIHHFLHGGQHADLAQLYHDHAQPNRERHGVFTMGGGGSGKSYQAKKTYLKHPRFVQIDPDAIKEHLATSEGKPGAHNTNAPHYHEESSDIAKKLHGRAMAQGRDFVYDGTGAGAESFLPKLSATKAAGYKTHILYAKTDVATALKRNAGRARKVPEDVLIHQHSQVAHSFAQNKHLADRIKVIDTSEGSPKSAHTQAREERQRAMQKGMGKHEGGAEGKMHKICLGPDHHILGRVVGGHVHVHDIVHEGISEHALTGESPKLRPISLGRLKRMGATLER